MSRVLRDVWRILTGRLPMSYLEVLQETLEGFADGSVVLREEEPARFKSTPPLTISEQRRFPNPPLELPRKFCFCGQPIDGPIAKWVGNEAIAYRCINCGHLYVSETLSRQRLLSKGIEADRTPEDIGAMKADFLGRFMGDTLDVPKLLGEDGKL